MNRKHILVGGCLTLACALGANAQTPTAPRSSDQAAPAQSTTPPMKQARSENPIDAQHKAAMEKCKGLEGNAKDVCKAEADGQRKVARAEAKLKDKDTEKNRRDVEKAKADAQYDLAKEKCEDQKGDAEEACKKEAKAKRDMALASASKPNQRAKSQ